MTLEFSRRTNGLLAQVATLCERRGVKLTELRRVVLGMVLDNATPVGGYEILDRLRESRRAEPPTVYRTLDFLLEQGLVHRVERLSAFVGCIAGCSASPDEHSHAHAVQFLICHACGRVIELQDHEVTAILTSAAKDNGFTITHATVEAEGLCEACRRAAARKETLHGSSE